MSYATHNFLSYLFGGNAANVDLRLKVQAVNGVKVKETFVNNRFYYSNCNCNRHVSKRSIQQSLYKIWLDT